MRVAIVYESLFGNTREIAEAIATGIRDTEPAIEVTCVSASSADISTASADLLVVGAPTHFFGLPSPRSRRLWVRPQAAAARRTRSDHPLEPGADGIGVRGWLDTLPSRPGAAAATFDTRLRRPLAGSAAKRIARRLRQLGYRVVGDAEGFLVEDMQGPLREAELTHARAWGAALVLRVTRAGLRSAS